MADSFKEGISRVEKVETEVLKTHPEKSAKNRSLIEVLNTGRFCVNLNCKLKEGRRDKGHSHGIDAIVSIGTIEEVELRP